MRIAWFTPLHTGSAIGEFSRHVGSALSRLAEVELWTSDDEPLQPTALPLAGYHAGSSELAALRDRDVIVYNLGNYLPYHADIYAVTREHPGIVILHDRALHHLFADMWLGGAEPNPPHYVERMKAHYGDIGAEIATATIKGERQPVWESEDELLRYPLYEEAITNAYGVVTHSESHAQDVRRRWTGPVEALKLPCYSDVLARERKHSPLEPQGPSAAQDERRMRLLTVGHLNPNKQVHRVIEMLAREPTLAARVDYRVVGPDGGFTSYTDGLRRQIAASGDALHVELVGWVSDEELERELRRADVFVNLRHPNVEGGSASLMKQLAFGRPVLCFDSGSFGELPEGTVQRIPVGDFDAAARALGKLLSEPESRRRLGYRARALAECYNERRYAEGLFGYIQRARHARPGLQFVDGVARELGQMSVDPQLPIFDEIAHDFARILSL